MRVLLAILAAFFLTASARTQVLAPTGANASPPPLAAIAAIAYANSVKTFWTGTPTGGHIVNLAQSGVYGSPMWAPLPLVIGDLWQYAQMVNLHYGYWKITGSADAANRITAEWTFVKANWTFGQLTSCGAGNPAAASDDAAWIAALYLEAYEVTSDATALTYAKDMLDCAYARWYDAATLGGGMWYDDSQNAKSSYQAAYAFASEWYYEITANTTYLTQAEAIDTWMAATLQRNGQVNPQNSGETYPNDGLYWQQINANTTIQGYATPYQIAQTSSVVFLTGNMAMAVLDARLYAATGTASYLTRMNSVAVGIQKYETDTSGVALDDRDARTNGWAAWLYALYVVPNLTSVGAFGDAGLVLTANSIYAHGMNLHGTFCGCWNGPCTNSCIWVTSDNLYPDQVEVSANAANWLIAAQGVGP